MVKQEKSNTVANVPPVPGSANRNASTWRPDQLDPELANLALAKHLVDKMGTPAIVDKPFIVRHAIARGMNHIPPTYHEVTRRVKVWDVDMDKEVIDEITELKMVHPGNPTYFDSSLRDSLYNMVEVGSVNVNGMYFEKIFAFLMKPKMIINGLPMGQNSFEDTEKQSIIERILGGLRGGNKNNGNADNNK